MVVDVIVCPAWCDDRGGDTGGCVFHRLDGIRIVADRHIFRILAGAADGEHAIVNNDREHIGGAVNSNLGFDRFLIQKPWIDSHFISFVQVVQIKAKEIVAQDRN